jgi:peptide/nickel transport system permease protein
VDSAPSSFESSARGLERVATNGYWRQAAVALLRNPAARAGLAIVLLVLLPAVLAPWIAPYDPNAQDPRVALAAMSPAHILGGDEYGRDVLSRLLFASREAITVGMLAVFIGAAAGTLLGVASGYAGGVVDAAMMRLTDMAFGFPAVVVGIMVVAIVGAGEGGLAGAIALYNVPVFVRLTRGLVMQAKQRGYVEAAMTLGSRAGQVLRWHVLPDIASPLVIQAGVSMPEAIILAAGLSFLGLGAPPPAATLGGMLADARPYLIDAPWLVLAPGLVLSLLVVGMNITVDALRDILDPRFLSVAA